MFILLKKKCLIFSLIISQILVYSDFASFAESNNPTPEINTNVEPQKVIAVSDFSNDTGEPAMDYLKKGLANSLVTSLGMNPRSSFSIVERGQLESLIKEMGLTESGLVDVNNAIKIGNALGASQIIVGGLIKLGTTLRLNVRVIDIKTSRLLLAFSEYAASEGEVLKQLDKVADEIVAQLSPKIVAVPSQTIVPEPSPKAITEPLPKSIIETSIVNKNIPAENIRNMKIEDPDPEQGVPVWLWVTGGVVVTAAVIIIGIFVSKKATVKTPTPTPTLHPILHK